MPNDNREARADAIQVLLPWGMPSSESREDFFDSAALWLTGGAFLVLWTALALLLTSA
jgi:hypothetical protein